MNLQTLQLSDPDRARLEQLLLDFDQNWTEHHLGILAGQLAAESPEFKEFVSNLPPTDRSEAERVIAAGSAREINALLTQFKQSAGAAGNDDALEAAEGVRSSGIRLPKPPAAADDDFVSAWNES